MLFSRRQSTPSKNLLRNIQQEMGEQSIDEVISSFESTRDAAILEVLREFQQLKACVRDDGTIYFVEDQVATRPFEKLRSTVQSVYNLVKVESVTRDQYSRLSARIESSNQDKKDSNQRPNTDVAHVLQSAIDANASDIYLLLHEKDTQLRFRVNGIMHEFARYSAFDGRHMVRALWSMANSGQFHMEAPTDCIFNFGGRRIRGNSLPDTRGCSVVLRLRDPNFRLNLNSLGYEEAQLSAIQDMFAAPNGLSVIGGTTNSGKSTTLTSLMAAINEMQHVIEIADPIEIEFEHVTHSEINNYAEDAEQTFRAKLAALVRQNPDLLFLGEIRDLDSATAAVHMAMQGKRVWSTVHTGDCVSTLTRLEILGIEHNQLCAPNFLNGIINQSLIPLLCDKCALSEPKSDKDRQELETLDSRIEQTSMRFLNPTGCSECYLGVVGQTVVAEVWPFCWDHQKQCQTYMQDRRYQELMTFARERFKQPTKYEHAAQKMQLGQVDPLLTQSIIGKLQLSESSPIS